MAAGEELPGLVGREPAVLDQPAGQPDRRIVGRLGLELAADLRHAPRAEPVPT